MTNFRRFGCTMMAACVLAVAGSGSAQAGKPAPAPKPKPSFRYDFVDVGLLPGGTFSFATAVNNSCDVVGNGDGDPTSYGIKGGPFLWSPFDGMRNLNDLIDPAQRCRFMGALDINDAGQISGYGAFDENNDGKLDGQMRVLRFTPDDDDPDAYGWVEALDVEPVTGSNRQGAAINATGDVVGWFSDASNVFHAFLYTNETGFIDLGIVPNGSCFGRGISDRDAAGQVTVVGDYGTNTVAWKATCTPSPEMTVPSRQSLGFLYSSVRTPGRSTAVSVNQSGQIVGSTSVSNSDDLAARYTDATGWVSLGTLAPAKASSWNDSEASDINNGGLTIGRSMTGNVDDVPNMRGFIHADAFGMWDLASLVDSPSSLAAIIGLPSRINDNKDICGPGYVGNPDVAANRAYLLIAKPAP